jgi:hypothetical protein
VRSRPRPEARRAAHARPDHADAPTWRELLATGAGGRHPLRHGSSSHGVDPSGDWTA